MPPINPPNSCGKERWHAEFMHARTYVRIWSALHNSQNVPQILSFLRIQLHKNQATLQSNEELAGCSVICESWQDFFTIFREPAQNSGWRSFCKAATALCKHAEAIWLRAQKMWVSNAKHKWRQSVQSRAHSNSLQGLFQKEAIVS